MFVVRCYSNGSGNESDAVTCDRWCYMLIFVLEYNIKFFDVNLMVVTYTHIRLENCAIYRHMYMAFSVVVHSFILLASTLQLFPVMETQRCSHFRLKTSSFKRSFPFALMHNLCIVTQSLG
jgi:hypothetical protein